MSSLAEDAVARPGEQISAALEARFTREIFGQRHRLQALALSILGDPGEAEDAVQETLIRAWRAWPTGSRHEDSFAWAMRICVNHCLSTRRKLTTRGFFGRSALPEQLPGGTGQRDPVLLDVRRAFARLSPKQRAALALNKGHGYSIDECAVLMGCGAGSVRTHLARALNALREELNDDAA